MHVDEETGGRGIFAARVIIAWQRYLFVVITEEEAASLLHDIIRLIYTIQSLPHPCRAPLARLAHIHVHQRTRCFQPDRCPTPETSELSVPPLRVSAPSCVPGRQLQVLSMNAQRSEGRPPRTLPAPHPLCSQTEGNSHCGLFFLPFHALT